MYLNYEKANRHNVFLIHEILYYLSLLEHIIRVANNVIDMLHSF